jgi:hypothetical protein
MHDFLFTFLRELPNLLCPRTSLPSLARVEAFLKKKPVAGPCAAGSEGV